MTVEEYKGYHIDTETEAPDRLVVYDPVEGDYLCHDPFYSVEQCKEYIDKLEEEEKMNNIDSINGVKYTGYYKK